MPQRVWLVVIGVVVVGGSFAAVVAPLLVTAGHHRPTAEVAGRVPDTARLDVPLEIQVAIDNTSTSVIGPLCLVVRTDPPAEVREARFQGLDRVPFRDGRACGGELSGQETVSVVVVVVFHQLGDTSVDLAPAEDGTVIGPSLHGTVVVIR